MTSAREEQLVIAVGGTAWRNRPLAYLESVAHEGVVPTVVVALDATDLAGWAPQLWGEVELRMITGGRFERNDVVQGMWAAALGLGSNQPDAPVLPFRPDLAVLHYPYADEEGAVYSLQADETSWFNELIVKVSRRVIVTVDEILTDAQRRRAAPMQRLSASSIDEVRHVPYGAYPGACDGMYCADEVAKSALAVRAMEGIAPGSNRLEALATPGRLAAASLPHGLQWPRR
jgi:hypothetical protein